VSDSLVKSQSLFLDEKDPTKIREDILRSEKIVDEHQRDITLYLAKVMEANLTHEQSNEVRSLIRIADELESVSDYCESLARYKNRCIKEKITFSQAAIKDIVEMQERTCQYFQKALDAYKNSEVTYITQAKVAGNEINDFADSVRDAHLERMNKNLCNPYASLVFSDVMVALRRIKNHTFNIVEATAGLK
jgi:phosphate:Na+ symporter